MNAKQFFDLTASMRSAQKEYFKTRSRDALYRSKTLEKRIDEEIERVNNITRPDSPEQPTLWQKQKETEKK